MRIRFANGASARVYRETVVGGATMDPCALGVEFQLWRWAIRGRRTHALFRWESLLNTPLFVGFPSIVGRRCDFRLYDERVLATHPVERLASRERDSVSRLFHENSIWPPMRRD
jgi:hypothetical protein